MAVLLEQLVHQSVRHSAYLERLKAGEANQFAAFLDDIYKSIRLKIGGEDLTEFSRVRFERLLSSVRKDLDGIYVKYWDELSGSLIDIAEYETGFEARSLNNVLPSGIETVVPSSTQAWAAVKARPLSVPGIHNGDLLEPFIKGWTGAEVKRVTGAIRSGFYAGKTTQQILKEIRGTKSKSGRYVGGLLESVDRNTRTAVKTALQHTAVVARQRTWEANKDIVIGRRMVVTFDGRTSRFCRSIDVVKIFPIGSGISPPFHPDCRTSEVAVLHEKYDYLNEGAQRSARDSNGKVFSLDAENTYYDFLRTQPASFQDSTLGKTYGKLFRDGGLSSERFAELNLNKDFTPLVTRNGRTPLQQMRDLEPTAFEKAGL